MNSASFTPVEDFKKPKEDSRTPKTSSLEKKKSLIRLSGR